MTAPRELYEKLVATLQSQFEIERKSKGGFGSGLRINGQVFAMFSQGALVIREEDRFPLATAALEMVLHKKGVKNEN